MKKTPENLIQQQIVLYLNANYFKTHIVFSVPNEIPYPLPTKIMALILSKLQSYGMLKGANDLTIYGPNQKYISVEVKTEKGTQSPAQVIFQKRVESIGGIYLIVRSLEDFIEKFNVYL
ncbi:MAG: hypothetical protein LH615_04040 [Ferruginibacter sp.]|nr:hypothetical protein [Ferruginibacter sp.]